MKPLTPFQKKVARRVESLSSASHNLIVWSMILALISCCIFTVLSAAPNAAMRLSYLAAAFLSLLYFVVGFQVCFSVAQWRWQLPERAIKKARQTIDDQPQFSRVLNPLIVTAAQHDEADELNDMLSTIQLFLSLGKSLSEKEDSVVHLKEQIKSHKQQIAALEKELGLNS